MIVAGDLLLLAGGLGLLRLACPGPWPFGVAGGLGLGFLCGSVALALATTLLGVAGLPLWPVVLALGGLAAAGLRRGRPLPDGGRTAGLAGVAAGALGAWLAIAAASGRVVLNDEYAIWALRGRALSLADGLGSPVFTDAAAQYQHLDYPLLVPALVGWADRWSSGAPEGPAHVQVALLAGAMLLVVGWAVARLAGPLAAAAAVLLAVAPTRFAEMTQRVHADVPAAAFAVATLLLVAVWLRDEEDDRLLRVAAITAAGAVYTKNEGALYGLATFAAAALVARRRRPVALAAAAAALAYAPWALWTRAHGIHSDVLNRATLRPSRLLDELDRLGAIWSGMSGAWPTALWALVAAAVAGALGARAGHARLVVLLAGTVAASLAGLAFVYVATPLELEGQLRVSAYRVQLYPALVVLLSIPLLAGLAARASPESPRS
ncbi:MAG: hypothetical protein QOE65_294 [Solirubrobacteraceae bacterium]|nr:hypothetical protein [Solirubrobacteraceae bacterium]